MDTPKGTARVLIFLVPLGVALVGVLFLLKGLSAPLPTPAPPTPTPDPGQEVVAHVGEQRITFADWAVAYYLDALMNYLSGQPAPAASETLDRLVNDALILAAAAEEEIAVGEADVQARITLLEAAWGLTDEQVTAELSAIGLTRGVWAGTIARLLTVERYRNEVVWAGVPAEEQVNALNAWLQARYARIDVEVDTRGLRPTLPETMPQFSAAATVPPSPAFTATPPVASPLATPSATPLAASPLATPALPTPTFATPVPNASSPPAVGQPAPDFTLLDHDGRPVSLGDLRDQRRVVIVFVRTTG